MRVLALADRPFHADVAKLASQCDVEAIVTLGDLQPSWLETLDKVCLPKLGVYGNHDDEPYMTWFGIDNVHVNRIDLDNGVSFSGFEGCVSYRRSGSAKVGPSYTQRAGQEADPQAARRRRAALPLPAARRQRRPRRSGAHRLRGAAPVGARAPARAGCCTATSTRRPGKLLNRIGDTRVVYVNGARVIELS